ADPMPRGMGFDGEIVQSIGIGRPYVVPARRFPRPDLCCDRPRFAELCAQWRVIERAQELSIVLRIVEIDFHKTSFLITRKYFKSRTSTAAKFCRRKFLSKPAAPAMPSHPELPSPLSAGYRAPRPRLHN